MDRAGNAQRTAAVFGTGLVLVAVYLFVAFRLGPPEAKPLPPPTTTPTRDMAALLPSPSATSIPTLLPTLTPSPLPALLPTPLTALPASTGLGGLRPDCKSSLVVIVYSDDNRDEMPSPGEAISGVQIILTDSTFSRLGTAYARDGKAEFCLPEGKVFYVDLPYFQITRIYQPGITNAGNSNTLEIRINPPVLPVRLP